MLIHTPKGNNDYGDDDDDIKVMMMMVMMRTHREAELELVAGAASLLQLKWFS